MVTERIDFLNQQSHFVSEHLKHFGTNWFCCPVRRLTSFRRRPHVLQRWVLVRGLRAAAADRRQRDLQGVFTESGRGPSAVAS